MAKINKTRILLAQGRKFFLNQEFLRSFQKDLMRYVKINSRLIKKDLD